MLYYTIIFIIILGLIDNSTGGQTPTPLHPCFLKAARGSAAQNLVVPNARTLRGPK